MRQLALPCLGLVVMLLTALVVVSLASGDRERVEAGGPPSSIELGGREGSVKPEVALEPVAPPVPRDPVVPTGPDSVPAPATLPAPGVATIPLPDLSTGATGHGGATTSTTVGPAFIEAGVWVVNSDGTSPILVARSATAGVAGDRVLLERASTPVVATSRILYVSSNRAVASVSLAGTGATTVATAGPGSSITDLDLLDDTTLVVTVA